MKTLADVTAFVLVGGLGTRLRAVIGEETPKPLAKIGDQPFLRLLLEWLGQQGIRNVVLGTGHLATEFETLLTSYCPVGMTVAFSLEREPLGTGGAIRNGLHLVSSDPVLVLNGDSIANIDLNRMLGEHLSKDALVTVGVVQVPDSSRFGTVRVTDQGVLSEFLEKTGDAQPALINAGMYLISGEALAMLPEGRSSLEKDFLEPKAAEGIVRGFVADSDFIDIGTPESYAQAEAFFARFLK